MYRIYMPVDMVLAITHSNMRRERIDRLYKQRLNAMVATAAATAAMRTYEKGDEREMQEKLDNSLKNNNCIEMFRFW
jgi:galactokinase